MGIQRFTRAMAVFIIAAAPSSVSLFAQSVPNLISGIGWAEITEDVSSVRASAEAAARLELASAILVDALGSERAGGVSDEVRQALADQIQPVMIANQEGRREGGRYKVTIQANIEPAWLNNQLRIRGIASSSQVAGASRQLIFVMLDQNNAAARDYSKPQEIVTEFSKSKGASFSDKSISAASDKEKAASSYKSRAGSSERSNSAAGISTRRGSAAARSSASASSASSERASSAYSRSTSAVQRNNVQAEVHDDMYYRQEIRMQKVDAKSQPSDYALSAISRELLNYGVEFADAGPSLNSFFAGKRPLWAELKNDPRLDAFQASLSAKQGAFFMGGSMTVQDTNGEGVFRCTGSLEARVSATLNGRIIASGSATGSASDINSAERCESKLAERLSVEVVRSIGPQIKIFWLSETAKQ